MSDCPRDLFNRPMCLIVEHPEYDRKFCATCKKRFVESDDSGWSWLLMLFLVIIVVVLMSGCDRRQPETDKGQSTLFYPNIQARINL